jgi:L-seryl-tRNA(Ser) seleniumtransferase
MQGVSTGCRARPRATMGEHGDTGALRALPSVERLLQTEPLRSAAERGPRTLAADVARRLLDRCRDEIRRGNGTVPGAAELAARAATELRALGRPRLAPLVNATGVVIHTNLGRAPLALAALDALESVGSGYSNLEYDVETGARGSRRAHVEGLLRELTGAEAALTVNNNAAAVLLAVAALAGGREVVVSRGQLVEIGGSFRIPEILAASGARLVEVGTTNRTRIGDYERAIGADTAALMRAHPSNFRTVGFTEEASLPELCELAARRGLAVIDDVGSGVLRRTPGRLGALLADEPAAADSVAAGADVVCFSGDKLLGGPQAGIAVGTGAAIGLMAAHPLARAVRIDKLSLAALEATLRLHRDPGLAAADVPVLEMLAADERDLLARAVRIHDGIAEDLPAGSTVRVAKAAGRAGGGSLPLLELEGPVVAVSARAGAEALAERLRRGDPAIVARVHEGVVLLDPRTVSEVEVDFLVRGVRAALRALA